MDTPQIYVACLASYKEGINFGKWIDATQCEDDIYQDIHDMLAKSPVDDATEWALHDYSGFGKARFDDDERIENIVKIVEFLAVHGDLGATLLGDYFVEEAIVLLEEHHEAYNYEIDFGRTLFEGCYSNTILNNVIY